MVLLAPHDSRREPLAQRLPGAPRSAVRWARREYNQRLCSLIRAHLQKAWADVKGRVECAVLAIPSIAGAARRLEGARRGG
jgi:hypothetical protein